MTPRHARTSRPSGRPAVTDWDKQPLGVVADDALARTLKCSRAAVGQQRRARNIPPCAEQRRAQERAGLEAALTQVLDGDRVNLIVVAAISTIGWRAEINRGGNGGDRRFTLYRFARPGARTFSTWMRSRDARDWLLASGWADAAEKRIDELTPPALDDDTERTPTP